MARPGPHTNWPAPALAFGGIDGAASLLGCFPAERVGFVVLTNIDAAYGGPFVFSIESCLLSRLLTLDRENPACWATALAAQEQQTAEVTGQSRPVSPTEVAPFLGLYGDGFGVRLDAAGSLWLEHDIRSMPLLAQADGGYSVADGPAVVSGKRVSFAVGPDSWPVLTIEGFDPIPWLTGP